MKLLAGMALFLLCAMMGEGRVRRLQRREQTLTRLHGLLREIGERQLTGLASFREAAMRCPASPEREWLLTLLQDKEAQISLLTPEEAASISAYARSDNRSLAALRAERDALLTLLLRERDGVKEERRGKGQVYRSVGYLFGVAAMLLVL